MDPLSGIGSIATAGAGLAASELQQAQANKEFQNAVDQFTSIGVPPAQATQLVFQQYQSAGKLTPQLQTAFLQHQNAMNNIQTDPGLHDAQLQALGQLEQIGHSGGENLQMQADLQNANNQINSENAGRLGALQQSFAQRGMGQPSGLELQAQLANNQNMTQQQASDTLNEQAQAQQNALHAIEQGGGMAGQMQQQQFGQQAQVANAQNQINQFNMSMLNSANAANTQAQNQAQAANLANQQAINNANTTGQNSMNQYNAQQVQQNYQNQLERASGASGQYQAAAKNQTQQAQNTANMFGGLSQGIAQLGAAYGQKNSTGNAYNSAATEANQGAGDYAQNMNQTEMQAGD